MATQSATLPAPSSIDAPNLNQVRFRFLEGSSELLLGQLRLHAKRIRALAASFRREIRRIETGVGPEMDRIDSSLDRVSQQTTVALRAIDSAFVAVFAGVAALESYLTSRDVEHPDLTPGQRISGHATDLLGSLRGQHAEAGAALRIVVEQLIVNANNLAIVVGQPGTQSLDHLRVVIRQMRTLSGRTYDLGGRLDVFVQNLSAALQELAPADSLRDSVLASLRAMQASAAGAATEGAD
jgi:hypothetical protein